jgi:hypothetical protein
MDAPAIFRLASVSSLKEELDWRAEILRASWVIPFQKSCFSNENTVNAIVQERTFVEPDSVLFIRPY